MLGPRQLRCSFCGKNEDEVKKLVGGANAFICDECVATAVEIMEAHPPDVTSSDTEDSGSKGGSGAADAIEWTGRTPKNES